MLDFAQLIESAYIEQRVSAKTGNKYNMLILKIEGGIEFQYICTHGEENVVKILGEHSDKK